MMKAASTSETSVNFYQTTQRNNPEDSHLHGVSRFVTSSITHFVVPSIDFSELVILVRKWKDNVLIDIMVSYFGDRR
jgi:hypothetical protein